jgi:hypothetical protein
MDERLLWFGLIVLIVIAIVALLLWAGGERPSWADWQDKHHSGGKGKADDGDAGD